MCCPDLEDYEARRGRNVDDYLSIVPVPRLASLADFETFLRECLQPTEESRAVRSRSAELIGAETRLGATDRLFDAVAVPPAPTVVSDEGPDMAPDAAPGAGPAVSVPPSQLPLQRTSHHDSGSTSSLASDAAPGR